MKEVTRKLILLCLFVFEGNHEANVACSEN